VWNNTSGDVLTAEQKAAFRSYIENGGGFVGIHARAAIRPISGIGMCRRCWPRSSSRTPLVALPTRHDPCGEAGRSGDAGVAEGLEPYRRVVLIQEQPAEKGVTVLATLDESTYQPVGFFGSNIAMGPDHPIIWKHCVGKGRVFYSALGHQASAYQETGVPGSIGRRHLLGRRPLRRRLHRWVSYAGLDSDNDPGRSPVLWAGQDGVFSIETPKLLPCTGLAAVVPRPDLLAEPHPDFNMTQSYKASLEDWCEIALEPTAGHELTDRSVDSALEEMFPNAARGAIESRFVTRSGCLAFRAETYPQFTISRSYTRCADSKRVVLLHAAVVRFRVESFF